MSIERGSDRNGEYIIITGEVNGVYYNELKQRKTYGSKGWTPTHGLVIKVDGHKIGLGLVDKEDKPVLRCKDTNGNYQDVDRGAEVSIEVESDGEYKGVEQFKALPKNLVVTKAAPAGGAPAGNSGYKGGKKKDNTGQQIGHALRCGAILHKNLGVDYLEGAKAAHDVTQRVITWYTENNTHNLDEYESGMAGGNAVWNACYFVDSIENLEKYSTAILTKHAVEIRDYITGSGSVNSPADTEDKELEESMEGLEDDVAF